MLTDEIVRVYLDKNPKDMTREELESEVRGWREIWIRCDDKTQWLLRLLGKPVRVVRRDYKGDFGELKGVIFEPVEYILEEIDAVYDSVSSERMIERRERRINATMVIAIDEIAGQISEEDYKKAAENEEG